MSFYAGRDAIRRSTLVLTIGLAALTASTVNAQIYRCEKDGKTSFQEAPCDPTSSVSKPITTRAPGPEMLWNSLKYGMTVKEVRQRVPNAIPKSEDWLASGAREQLRIERVRLAGVLFTAQFFFMGESFKQVNYAGPMMESNEDNLRSFNQVLADFRIAHGQESQRKISNESFGLSASAEWSTANGRVWLSIVPVTDETSLFNLGFVPRESAGRR